MKNKGFDINDFNMDFFSLKGKNAIVTGGNSGLGQAFSLALAKGGANVLVASNIEDDGTTRRLIEGAGAKMEFMKVDISEKGVPKQIVQACVERLGSIDILVNCAAVNLVDDVMKYSREKWDPMIAINLTAAFELIQEAIQYMVPQRSGKIINICSLFSYLGGQGAPAYAAMKHGLAGLTKTYADELGQYNIQVNGIAPGYFATKITEYTRKDPVKSQRILDHIPANRWGETQDLMGACIFLASDAARYVNGTLLVVDGGYLVR
jgi:NAD(P)-dependent dehydrogenase (short-subunit alcohol dehydrogenase family)